MSFGIIGRKQGMTHIFDEKGNMIPVTVIKAGPCTITKIRNSEKEQATSIQLGFEEIKEKLITKPEIGFFKKNNLTPFRTLKEFKVPAVDPSLKTGDQITVTAFNDCQFVDITGTSKGRGFSGVIKRHNFHRPKQTHGTHEKFRHGGSLGCRYPQHVMKGKKMAGQYGNSKVTTQNIKVFSVREEDNAILVRGAIPGPTNEIVFIRPALKKHSSK